MNIHKENGKKGVKVKTDRWDGIEVSTCRNGYQWNSFHLDTELLIMLRDSIDEYLLAKEHENL